ncbi:hypothetical protein PVAR5_0636 [Paecilomyces variotii No. 5]|uniref:Protein kinase domain-containing protein n=1 Tax=Byssochlamys spectabilis (strain No. 5 / NBRC 109023) TaxID=1356009 RepID=V5HRQ8_BYSSN|nr:hypothetical protein PVAR5_0636 [Paecilomyces variotii No. 5]
MAQDLNSLLEKIKQAEQRAEKAEQQLEQAELQRKQVEQRLQAEQQLGPRTLFGVLEGCHELSLAEAGAPPGPPSLSSLRNNCSGRARGGLGRGQASLEAGGRSKGTESTKSRHHQYCTMKCLSGLVKGDPLDPSCPNVKEHGHIVHGLNADDFTRLLSDQLSGDRETGFEQLHIVGRTGFILKGTLLSHGYTVLLKATTAQRLPNLKEEVKVYRQLDLLQRKQISVCIGDFALQVPYWYHGQHMVHMLILSWAGIRVKKVITAQNESFFLQQRDGILSHIKAVGVTHNDAEWRNILWSEETDGLVVIDFESPPKPCNS